MFKSTKPRHVLKLARVNRFSDFRQYQRKTGTCLNTVLNAHLYVGFFLYKKYGIYV